MMLILTIRTDKPEAEIRLYEMSRMLGEVTWIAHRELAETLHYKIEELLSGQHRTVQDLRAVVCFKGPGSFTGLRIGLSVANALSYALAIPIVSITGSDWEKNGIDAITRGLNECYALPEYGALAHITEQKR